MQHLVCGKISLSKRKTELVYYESFNNIDITIWAEINVIKLPNSEH